MLSCETLAGGPPVPGVSRTEAGQQDPGSQTSTDPAGRGAEPRRTMPDPRLMLLVCQTLMPDLGRTRPDAAPDAGRRPRTPAGLQPGLPAQGRVFRPGAGGAAYGSFGRGGGDSPFTTRRLEGEGWRRVAGCRR